MSLDTAPVLGLALLQRLQKTVDARHFMRRVLPNIQKWMTFLQDAWMCRHVLLPNLAELYPKPLELACMPILFHGVTSYDGVNHSSGIRQTKEECLSDYKRILTYVANLGEKAWAQGECWDWGEDGEKGPQDMFHNKQGVAHVLDFLEHKYDTCPQCGEGFQRKDSLYVCARTKEVYHTECSLV